MVLLAIECSGRAQIPLPAGTASQFYYDYDTGVWNYGYDTGDVQNGEDIGFYDAGGPNPYGGGFLEFANAGGGSFGGQNWGGAAYMLGYIDPDSNNLVLTNFSGYLFQPAPGANDYAIIGPLGTSSTNDGSLADNDELAGASAEDAGDSSGYYVYQGQFSQATSYTVDMGSNTVAVLAVGAGLLPADTGGITEASPNLNLSGAFTSSVEASIAGDDSEAVTISGSSGGSFSTPLLDLYGQVNVTGGKLSGDFMIIDDVLDPTIYAPGFDVPSTYTTVDVSGADASIVSSGSLLIGRSDNLPAQLTIEQGASGTFNNVYVGCGTADSKGTLKIDNGTVTISGFIEVGAGGSGTLLVQNGATLMTGTGQSDTDTGTYINGADADDESSATIDGSGTTWVNTGNLAIGYYANAPSTLTISNGADVQVTGELILGSGDGGEANLVLESGGTLEVGTAESANSQVESAIRATPQIASDSPPDPITVDTSNSGIIVGDAAGSTATITIEGSDTQLESEYTTDIIGDSSAGTLNIQNGASVAFQSVLVGNGAVGMINLTRDPTDPTSPGGTVTFSGQVIIGGDADGTLTISQGSQFTYNGAASTANGLELGDGSDATGTVMLTDSGSSVTTPLLILGAFGTGEFTVQNGATLTSAITCLGFVTGSSGTLTVDGGGQPGTSASLGDAFIGVNGMGLLNIKDGATVTATALGVALGLLEHQSNDANGSVVLTGNNSKLTVDGDADVGDGTNNYGIISVAGGSFFTANNVGLGLNGGFGRLILQGGGSTVTINNDLLVNGDSASARAVDVGANSTLTDSGNVTIDVPDLPELTTPDALVAGATSLWSVGGNLTVGQTANGEVYVQGAGHVNVSQNLIIAQNAGSSGRVVVSGSNSLLTVGGTTSIGNSVSTLAFTDGAQGNFTGTVTVTGGSFQVGYGFDSDEASTVVQTNAITVGGGGQNAQVNVGGGASLNSDSLINIEANGSVSVQGSINDGVPNESSLTADSINVGSQGSLSVTSGGIILTSGAINIEGAFSAAAHSVVGAGGGIIVDGVPVTLPGTPVQPAGALTGGGTLNANVVNAGTVAPGDPQTMTINGNYTQMATGNLVLVLDGSNSVDYDHLVVTGELSIQPGATIDLNFENGFAPTIGQTFDLVQYGSLDLLNPDFANVNITGLEAGFEYTITPVGTGGTDFQLTALNNGIATTTPEPSTWALLFAGISSLAFVSPRMRQRARPRFRSGFHAREPSEFQPISPESL